MNIRNWVLLIAIPVMLNGCAAYKNMNRKEDCDKMIKQYSRMIRWQEAEKTSMLFVDSKQRVEYNKAAESLRRRVVSIADYRILAHQCLPEQKKAEATVEFDYYIMPDNRLKTLTDHQTWIFYEENSAEPDMAEGWKLTSPLPDFK